MEEYAINFEIKKTTITTSIKCEVKGNLMTSQIKY